MLPFFDFKFSFYDTDESECSFGVIGSIIIRIGCALFTVGTSHSLRFAVITKIISKTFLNIDSTSAVVFHKLGPLTSRRIAAIEKFTPA